jgi:hypothetical protein
VICARGLVYDAGMRRIIPILIVVSGAALLALGQAPAQTAAVPVTGEPHHHLVYSDENVRAFDVEVPAHSSTMLHQHDVDYIWVALGDADVINAVAGKPEARLQIKDGTVHFTRGGFAHVARNENDSAFRNVTIELLKPQTNTRNLCDEVLTGGPLNCPVVHRDPGSKSTMKPEFETDQLLVTQLSIKPRVAFKIPTTGNPAILVALEGTIAESEEQFNTAGLSRRSAASLLRVRAGNIVYVDAQGRSTVTIHNKGKNPARFLTLEFKNASK